MACKEPSTPKPAAHPINEACALLGKISPSTLYRMARRGEIKIVKFGKRSAVPDSEITRLTAGKAA